MRLQAMMYLDAVARTGSVRKGAAQLGVASSSISRQISELERELGVLLFDRISGRIRLTGAGEMFLNYARQTLREFDKVQARIADLSSPNHGTVTIAATSGLAGSFIPAVSLQFSQRFQNARIAAVIRAGSDVVDDVIAGDVDIGLGYKLPRNPGLHVMEVFAVRHGAVVGRHHPLTRKTTVRLSECAEFPIISPDPRSPLYEVIQTAFARARTTYRSQAQTNSADFVKYTVMESDGVAFLSLPDVIEEVQDGQLVFIPLEERDTMTQNLVLVQRANAVLGQTASLYAEMLRTALRDLTRIQPARRPQSDSE